MKKSEDKKVLQCWDPRSKDFPLHHIASPCPKPKKVTKKKILYEELRCNCIGGSKVYPGNSFRVV